MLFVCREKFVNLNLTWKKIICYKKWHSHAPPVEKNSLSLRLNDCFALSRMTKIKASILADLSISGVCFEISLYIFITYFFFYD